jgi:hypothetical protein
MTVKHFTTLQLIIRRGLKKKGKFCLENYRIHLQLKSRKKFEWEK